MFKEEREFKFQGLTILADGKVEVKLSLRLSERARVIGRLSYSRRSWEVEGRYCSLICVTWF